MIFPTFCLVLINRQGKTPCHLSIDYVMIGDGEKIIAPQSSFLVGLKMADCLQKWVHQADFHISGTVHRIELAFS